MNGALFPVESGTGIERIPSVAAVAPVRRPAWRLVMAGQDVTEDVSKWVEVVTYTDHSHGMADDVEISLDNSDGRWSDAWYADQGTALELWIGYAGEELLPCGRFEVDETAIGGPPDVATIKALATGILPSLRTKRSESYEAQTMGQITARVAKRHGLTVTGLTREMRVDRLTQSKEDDLTFLTRLSEDYGYVFTVRGEQLVFYELAALDAAAAVFSIEKGKEASHSLRSQTAGVYRAATIRYHDPKSKEVLEYTAEAVDVPSGDEFRFYARVENKKQAEERAKAELRRRNSRALSGTITTEGQTARPAGINGQLVGFGRFDGKVHVEKSVHKLSRSVGYQTTLHVRGVPA